jgi:hypothetical protein
MLDKLRAAGDKANNNRRKLTLAALLSIATALSACSVSEETKTTTFTVGVECSDESTAQIINTTEVFGDGNNNKMGAIDISCVSEEGKRAAPSAMKLIAGSDKLASSDDRGPRLTYFDIDTHYQQGGGFDGIGDQDPSIIFRETEDYGRIIVREALTINEVRAG